MRVETSLPALVDLYRKLSPRPIPLDEGSAHPRLEPDDGLLARRYRHRRRIHASDP